MSVNIYLYYYSCTYVSQYLCTLLFMHLCQPIFICIMQLISYIDQYFFVSCSYFYFNMSLYYAVIFISICLCIMELFLFQYVFILCRYFYFNMSLYYAVIFIFSFSYYLRTCSCIINFFVLPLWRINSLFIYISNNTCIYFADKILSIFSLYYVICCISQYYLQYAFNLFGAYINQ